MVRAGTNVLTQKAKHGFTFELPRVRHGATLDLNKVVSNLDGTNDSHDHLGKKNDKTSIGISFRRVSEHSYKSD